MLAFEVGFIIHHFTMPTLLFPQFFFISILICTAHSHTQCLHDQETLLLRLKNEFIINSDIFSENKLLQWNQTSGDCCTWEGVECGGAGEVTGLRLDREAISGQLPPTLFNLKHLQKLNLSHNSFNFTQIPKAIANLTYLTHLDLSHADFGGPIPVELSLLTSLVTLDISWNTRIEPLNERMNLTTLVQNLTGLKQLILDRIDISVQESEWCEVISSYLPHLTVLSLTHCRLSSPPDQCLVRLSSLSTLKLDGNNLSTTAPDLFTSFANLTTLSLVRCSLTGSLPYQLFEGLSNLVHLHLSRNSLSGTIPLSLFRLSSLERLTLFSNQFSGTFRLENIERLHNLSELDLSYNNLFVVSSNVNYSMLPHLISLSLVSCNLHSLPDLRNQSRMNYLDLSNNSITGEIPNWIWDIGNIEERFYYLNLSCNLFSGLQTPYMFPSTLWVIDLHSNLLRGDLTPVPPPDCELFSFSIANNSLSGEIPSYFCNCTSLDVLDLSFNYLSGNIPSCLFENTRSFQVFNLRQNNVTGDIPDTFPVGCGIETLDLSNNKLEGSIPKSLANCTSLQSLNLGNNDLSDSFPCRLLPSGLRLLVLRSNRFHGDVQCHNESWPNLQIIDISSNNFSGDLSPISFSSWRGMMEDSDAQLMRNKLNFVTDVNLNYYQYEVELTIKGLNLVFVNIWGDFASIDFSSNHFRGKIPDSISDLGSLDYLNFSNNALTGGVPASLGKLRELGSLDLSGNQLTGTIPVELAGLTFLSFLNLSHNKLVGMIPIGPQIQTFSAESFQGNAGLCGRPLDVSCSNAGGDDSSKTKQPNGKTEIEWDYVSVALGYGVGIGGFVWLLVCCRSWRRRYFEKVDDVFDKIFDIQERKRRRRRRMLRNQVRRQ